MVRFDRGEKYYSTANIILYRVPDRTYRPLYYTGRSDGSRVLTAVAPAATDVVSVTKNSERGRHDYGRTTQIVVVDEGHYLKGKKRILTICNWRVDCRIRLYTRTHIASIYVIICASVRRSKRCVYYCK